MKNLVLLSLLMFNIYAAAQDKVDYSIAKAGMRISGMYVFVGCEPANDYDFAGDIKVNDFSWTQTTYFDKIIKKAKKKYPNANGIIFRHNTPKKAELITFRGIEKAGGGFREGDKVIALLYGKTKVKGTILQINQVKSKARVEYINGETTRIQWIPYKNIMKDQ